MKQGGDRGGEAAVLCPASALFIAAADSSRVTYVAHHLLSITSELLK